MSEPLVFVLPLPVNLGNDRSHHMAKYRAKLKYWAALDAAAIVRRIPCRPAKPFARALLDAEMYHTHDTDTDNREARLKWVLDWLTSRGYIVDDKDEHLARTGLVRAIPCYKVADRKLVLTLTEIAA
jgi:hypothetical protein